jgi:predicted DNA-binding transcriptional regulator AlpA
VAIYSVSVLVDTIDLTDDVLDALFGELDEVVPSSSDGVVRITGVVQATDGESAAFDLIEQIHGALPQAAAIRLDQDLVSIPDIADRTGRSRESVRLLVDGKRGPGRFPSPVGTVGDSIRVWPWAVVLEWFRELLDHDLGERGVSPEAAAFVDACLAGKIRNRRRRIPARP